MVKEEPRKVIHLESKNLKVQISFDPHRALSNYSLLIKVKDWAEKCKNPKTKHKLFKYATKLVKTNKIVKEEIRIENRVLIFKDK